MKVELKLYKTFDADLISLNANGISVSAMIKDALYHYCRGAIARFQIKECKPFNLTGLKRYIHVVANITDEKSIDFLKKEIKTRERSAFIRALLRECLVSQQLSVYLRNSDTIQKEEKRCQEIDLTDCDNVYPLAYNKRKHDYASEILKPAGGKKVKKETEKVKKEIKKENTEKKDIKEKTANQFGSVSDLALTGKKKKTLSEMVVPREELELPKMDPKLKKKKEEEQVVSTAAADIEEPWDDADDILSPSPVNDTVLSDTEEIGSDGSDDAFAQFENFLDMDNFV